MAVKKRSTLRNKSSKKIGNVTKKSVEEITKNDKIIDKIAEKVEKSIEDNKTTKFKIKSNSIISSTISTDPNQVGISKSAIRRRKRKLRDQLRPKLTEDLLDALTESTNTVINKGEDGKEEIIIEEKVKLNHLPNPLNKRGEIALFKIENEQFKQVLKNKDLRTGGLSALRNSILSNLNTE